MVLTKPLKPGFQGSVPSLNQSVTNGMVWPTGETLYGEQSGYFRHAFGHKLGPLISQHFYRNTHSTADIEYSLSYSLSSNLLEWNCSG